MAKKRNLPATNQEKVATPKQTEQPFRMFEGFEKIPPTIEGVPLRPKTKRRRKRRRDARLERVVQENQTPGFPFWPGFPGFPESVREVMVDYWKQFPSDAIPNTWVISRNPPEFGTVSQQMRYQTPTVTGETLFDDLFYTTLPGPPLGAFDPTYPEWVLVIESAHKRYEACPEKQESPRCTAAREAFYEAGRRYANALDKYWGLQRYQGGNVPPH